MDTIVPPRPGENAGNADAVTEIDRLEAQAAALLAHLDMQDRAANPPPEKNNLARPLVADLRGSLAYAPGGDLLATLERQALVLDNAFRRLLANADITFEDSERCDFSFPQYAAALRAQEQFCRTARAISHLKRAEKPKRRNRRRDEQTIKET